MASTLPQRRASDLVRNLDNIRPSSAKAMLASDRSVLFTAVVVGAVLKHYGSVKAAAISLRVDPSLMQREFAKGQFARLDGADDEAKAFISAALRAAFGTSDPKARRQRLVRDLRHIADELSEVIE